MPLTDDVADKIVKGYCAHMCMVSGAGGGSVIGRKSVPTGEMEILIYPYGREAKSKVTEIPQFSELTNLDADEAVYEERGDSVERAATTDGSLDAEQDSGNINRTQSTAIPNVPFPQRIGSGGSPRCQEAMGDTIAQTRSERVSTPSYDSPLLGVKTSGSDEERIELKELMDKGYKTVLTGVLDWRIRDYEFVEDKEVLKKGVSAAKDKDSTVDPVTTVGETVTTASVNPEDSTAVDVSVGSHIRLVDDSTTDDVTLAETLMAIRSSASRSQKLKGVVFKEPSEPITTSRLRPQPQIQAKDKGKGIMQEPEKPVKEKVGKDQIAHDADVAQRL
ncbi:hypothetical protein Tco_0806045 [Tanacetum coccineum]